MRKRNILLLALIVWVVFITTLSLVSLNGLPKISPKNGDKYVHFLFYFILTILLILNLNFELCDEIEKILELIFRVILDSNNEVI